MLLSYVHRQTNMMKYIDQIELLAVKMQKDGPINLAKKINIPPTTEVGTMSPYPTVDSVTITKYNHL